MNTGHRVLLSLNYYRRILRTYIIMYYVERRVPRYIFMAMVRGKLREMKRVWSRGVVMAVYRSVLQNTPFLGDTEEFAIEID